MKEHERGYRIGNWYNIGWGQAGWKENSKLNNKKGK